MSLRAGMLAGRRLAVTGEGPEADAVIAALRELGAEVEVLDAATAADEDAAAAWVAARRPLHALVVGAAAAFGDGGPERLSATLELTWRAARAVATGSLIESAEGGRLVFVAPRAGAGPHADAARAGLENLARTLSVEWARFAVTAVAVTPGAATEAGDIATLVAFLVSPAGGYYSGCRFDLGAVA